MIQWQIDGIFAIKDSTRFWQFYCTTVVFAGPALLLLMGRPTGSQQLLLLHGTLSNKTPDHWSGGGWRVWWHFSLYFWDWCCAGTLQIRISCTLLKISGGNNLNRQLLQI